MNFNILTLLEKWGFNKREILVAYSKISLGKDMGDSGYGDEVDCMISVFNIVYNSIEIKLGDRLSTYRVGQSLKYNPRWREVPIWKAEAPDIVLSATEGRNIGHIGIVGEFYPINKYPQEIYSNNSATGKWDTHWSIGSWYNFYVYKKKLEMKIYRLIL